MNFELEKKWRETVEKVSEHFGEILDMQSILFMIGVQELNKGFQKLSKDRKVDVIISDTDTGLDVRSPLIGCITIAATPLGATAGVNLYEAMRCSTAAEFVRGHDKRIPIVICIPAERRKKRDGIGLKRSYDGALHISKEKSGVTYV